MRVVAVTTGDSFTLCSITSDGVAITMGDSFTLCSIAMHN